jgi:hypothetical protein
MSFSRRSLPPVRILVSPHTAALDVMNKAAAGSVLSAPAPYLTTSELRPDIMKLGDSSASAANLTAANSAKTVPTSVAKTWGTGGSNGSGSNNVPSKLSGSGSFKADEFPTAAEAAKDSKERSKGRGAFAFGLLRRFLIAGLLLK